MTIVMVSSSYAIGFFAGLDLSSGPGTVSVASQAESNQVLVSSAGAFLGFRMFSFFGLGVRTAYSRIDQTSSPTAKSGNRRGVWVMPYAPVIRFEFSKFILFAEFDNTGAYQLAMGDVYGRQVTYKKPSGYTAEILYKINSALNFGLKYQKVDFSQEQVGTNSDSDLSDKINMTSYGGVIDVRF